MGFSMPDFVSAFFFSFLIHSPVVTFLLPYLEKERKKKQHNWAFFFLDCLSSCTFPRREHQTTHKHTYSNSPSLVFHPPPVNTALLLFFFLLFFPFSCVTYNFLLLVFFVLVIVERIWITVFPL